MIEITQTAVGTP